MRRSVDGEGIYLGRETPGEVILVPRLRAALERLNPQLPPEAITSAVDELTRDRAAMSLSGANREIYALLKEGVTVSVPDRERGGQKTERVRVVDWENPAANDFLLVSQMTITGPLYTCRPDLIGFVNGLPWVVIELKKPGVPARQAFDDNLTSYKHAQNGVPALFWHGVFLIASNGTESRVGTITADWERFSEWKRVEREDEPRRISLEVMLRGTCTPARLLDMAENFTLFSAHKSGLVKALAQNLQIELMSLPSYSPNLNLIERVWKFVKAEVLASRYLPTFDDFRNAIDGCLADLHGKHEPRMDTLLTLRFQTFENTPIWPA